MYLRILIIRHRQPCFGTAFGVVMMRPRALVIRIPSKTVGLVFLGFRAAGEGPLGPDSVTKHQDNNKLSLLPGSVEGVAPSPIYISEGMHRRFIFRLLALVQALTKKRQRLLTRIKPLHRRIKPLHRRIKPLHRRFKIWAIASTYLDTRM